MHNNFLMGVKLETSWGVDPIIFKNTLLERVLETMVSNLSVHALGDQVFKKLFFLFQKKIKEICFIKFTHLLKKKIFCKIEGKKLKGFPL